MNAGQVLAYSFNSQTLGREWRYNAYLPEGYEHSNLRYRCLLATGLGRILAAKW